jgi:uncharacterized membrane protein YukC
MIKKSLIISAFVASMLTAGYAFAEDAQPVSTTGPLMTQQEIQAYQDKLRNAQTSEERHQIQMEHQATVQERAKARSDAHRKEYDERNAAHESKDDMDKGKGSGKGDGSGTGGGKGH